MGLRTLKAITYLQGISLRTGCCLNRWVESSHFRIVGDSIHLLKELQNPKSQSLDTD